MNKRTLLILMGLVLLLGGWYVFRPERLIVDQRVSEKLPASAPAQGGSTAGAPTMLFTGRFHGVAHESAGIATIYQLTDGKRLLRLTEFETSNGPELYLYLVAAADANDSDTVKTAGFVSLGPLKGNKGDQNYDIPADTDFAKYQSVTVWCRRFGVNFATAPLMRQ